MPLPHRTLRTFGKSSNQLVRRAAVVVIETCFVLAIDTCLGVPLRALLDLLSRQVHEYLSFRPTDAACPVWCDVHPPGLIVDDTVLYMADRLVAPLNVISADLLVATQVDVTVTRWLVGTFRGCLVPHARCQTTRTPATKSRALPVEGIPIYRT